MKLFLFVLTLFFSLKAWSTGGLFGPEWTFYNPRINDSYSIGNSLSKISKIIKSKCHHCKFKGYLSFTLDGFDYFLTYDSPVIEIKASPMTTRQIKDQLQNIQLIFDSVKKEGFKPHYRLVGGHIHLDKRTHFKNNILLFRNFLVDLYNNSELFMGALSHDYLNAPPLAVLGKESKRELKSLLKEVDKSILSHKEITFDYHYLLNRINYDVYGIHSDSLPLESGGGGRKYQAVNLNHEDTIEVRGFQPQQSAEHYLKMTLLLEARLKYLSQFKKPIPYKEKHYEEKISWTWDRKKNLHAYKTSLSSGLIISVYRNYVEESGLNWNEYKQYIADKRIGNRIKKIYPSSRTCNQLF